MDYQELKAALLGSESPDFESVKALVEEHDRLLSEHGGFVESAQEKVALLSGNIDKLNQQLSELKAKNYDLLMQVPATPEPAPEPVDEPAGVDSLFEMKVK